VALTVLFGAVGYAVHPAYDRLLAGTVGGFVRAVERGEGSTGVVAVAGGIEVDPADGSRPGFLLRTADQHLAGPLVLALLLAGVWRRGRGARAAFSRFAWGLGLIFLVHAVALAVEIEFRPLLDGGYRQATFYVYRFAWWVVDIWGLLLLPGGVVLFVYLHDWQAVDAAGITRRGGRGRLLVRSAGAVALTAAVIFGLVALRPSLPAGAAPAAGAAAAAPSPAPADPAQEAFAAGRFPEAEATYRERLQVDPADVAADFALGTTLYRQGKFGDALAAFERVQSQRPNFPGLQLALGAALYDLNERERAAGAFARADLNTVSDVKLLQQVGGALYLANDLMGAERAYRRIVQIAPRDAVGWYNLGNVLAVRGQAEPAIAALEQAVAVKPDYFEAYNNLGALYRQARGPAAALDAYREAARLNPAGAPAHYNLGKLRIELGDPCAAREDLRRCVALPDRRGVQPRCAKLLEEAERRCPA